MKKVCLTIRYFLLLCLILILCYGLFKRNPYQIRISGLLCVFWFLLFLYEKQQGKNKVIDAVLLTLSSLALVLCMTTLFGL